MRPPLVAVDIGNSTVKLGVVGHFGRGETPQFSCLVEWPTAAFDPHTLHDHLPSEALRWCVASVHRPAERQLASWLRSVRVGDDYQLLSHRDLPIAVEVEHPERVGLDRLVAAVAANRLRDPACPAVVVDAGTAITVDAVNIAGVFLGGAILPGVRITAMALAMNTDLLPLVDTTFCATPPPVIGKSTVEAIRSGMYWGSVGAIRTLVTLIRQELVSEPQLFITGGDAKMLARSIDPQATFVPELVLSGIAWSVS